MVITEWVPLLQALDSPFGWILTFTLLVIPVILSVARQTLSFHNEHVRHYRAKNFESALEKLQPGSVEHQLLEECKAQELVYLNTKLKLSRLERAQVLQWLIEKPVTVSLIRKAWSNSRVENGQVLIHVPRYEFVFMVYSLVAAASIMITSFYFLVSLVPPVIREGAYIVLCIPLILFFFGYLVFRQSLPIAAARRLRYRLGQETFQQRTPGEVGQAVSENSGGTSCFRISD